MTRKVLSRKERKQAHKVHRENLCNYFGILEQAVLHPHHP